MFNFPKLSKYEEKALLFAEKHGIIEYKVKGSQMIYREKFPNEGIFKAIINLDTMKETRRQLYKRKN